eukprot:895352-Pyramimonas_sp.AAC.1
MGSDPARRDQWDQIRAQGSDPRAGIRSPAQKLIRKSGSDPDLIALIPQQGSAGSDPKTLRADLRGGRRRSGEARGRPHHSKARGR